MSGMVDPLKKKEKKNTDRIGSINFDSCNMEENGRTCFLWLPSVALLYW